MFLRKKSDNKHIIIILKTIFKSNTQISQELPHTNKEYHLCLN